MIETITTYLVYGIILGSMYAVVAGGLSLIWGTMKMLNFAHGEFYMIGAYTFFFLITLYNLNPFISLIISMIATFIIGMCVARLTIIPLIDKPGWMSSHIIATIGLMIFFQNFALVFWGERYRKPPYFIEGNIDIAGIPIAIQRLLILGVCLSMLAFLYIFIRKTKLGIAFRALAQDRETAQLMGVSVNKIYLLAFGISVSLAAGAGAVLSPIFAIFPTMGAIPLLKAFVVCVLGGLGNFEGAVIASFILGIIESLTTMFIGAEWKDVIAFIILIVTLTVRPSGLFARPS
jgi:branched-chain amino acid transport system permease protein